MCSLDSQISPPSKNRAPIYHESAKSLRSGQSLISSPRHGYCHVLFCGKNFWKLLVPGNLTCAQEPRWLRVAWWTRTFYICSSNWIITNTAHVQSVHYLRVGRSTFCHAISITRIPWVNFRVHHATHSHEGFWPHVRLPRTKSFQKLFSQRSTSQYPWRGKEIRNWPGLEDLALSRWIGARVFDAGEICESRLHTVTCLASLYVGKQHRTNNKPKNRIKWPWIEPTIGYTEKATTGPSLRKYNLFLYNIYAYISTGLTTILNFSYKFLNSS